MSMEYRLVYTSHLNIGEFETEIAAMMADGWRPAGGVATTITAEGGEVLYQAMVRELAGGAE